MGVLCERCAVASSFADMIDELISSSVDQIAELKVAVVLCDSCDRLRSFEQFC